MTDPDELPRGWRISRRDAKVGYDTVRHFELHRYMRTTKVVGGSWFKSKTEHTWEWVFQHEAIESRNNSNDEKACRNYLVQYALKELEAEEYAREHDQTTSDAGMFPADEGWKELS